MMVKVPVSVGELFDKIEGVDKELDLLIEDYKRYCEGFNYATSAF